MRIRLPAVTALLLLACALAQAWAAEAQVAVAANFAEPAKAIASELERATGHKLRLSFGATGAFHTQIRNGAPFDVFLAADDQRPAMLERDGLAVPGTRFTYAIGRLVLWSAKPARVDAEGKVLADPALGKVAYANPKTAPYGAAALQVLRRLGVEDQVRPRLVQGESIAQAYHYAKSGNADVGFVALSQVTRNGRLGEGSAWLVPATLYDPIRQDAVLLKRGEHNEAAQAFMRMLRGEGVVDLIRSYGYDR
jgi:molybdate transport system substrate-binding protein